MAKLLVVDDEQSICWGISRLATSLGHAVRAASSAEQALEMARLDRPDVVVMDVRLPGLDGLAAMTQLRAVAGELPIVIMTAYGDLPTAVEAVRQGAFEYLVKPFDLEQMRRVLLRACDPTRPATVEVSSRVAEGMIGKSPAMQEVFKRVALAASSDACVLLQGESGTGKELAARAVHQFSARASGPFVAVNVAALSPQLAESELFGHVRGAFTDAAEDRVGLLVQADGGTLFLDEVADIPLSVQVKLLRVLDHGEVLPVGSNQPVRSDFRVVSATHRRLLDRVATGEFRHDLYFRLNAFHVDLPPLRERQGDIAELAIHFARRRLGDKAASAFAQETLEELARRPWHGNVRELRHAVEHAVVLARGGVVLPEHLPLELTSPLDHRTNTASLPDQLAALIEQWAEQVLADPAQAGQIHEQFLRLVETPLFRAALRSSRGQCAAAARALGIHRVTLKGKLDEYGLSDEPGAP